MIPLTKATRASLAALVFVASFAGLVAMQAAPASAYSDISIDMTYQSWGGAGQAVSCTLRVQGGPAYDLGGNYTYKAEVVADNDTGSSVSPATATNQAGLFRFNVTLPGEGGQTITLKLNVTSKHTSAESTYKVKEYRIEVVQPIVITATVYNRGDVDAEDVTARFYADGELLGSQDFSVAAGKSVTLTHNWTSKAISDGKHTITVTVDDTNGIAEFSDGNNVLTMDIYVGDEGNPVGAVLTIGVIIMSVLVALTYMAKPMRRGGKKF